MQILRQIPHETAVNRFFIYADNMTTEEPKFWVRLMPLGDEVDVLCVAVPRVGECVQLPGKHELYVVESVMHRMVASADGSLRQLIGIELSPRPARLAETAEGRAE